MNNLPPIKMDVAPEWVVVCHLNPKFYNWDLMSGREDLTPNAVIMYMIINYGRNPFNWKIMAVNKGFRWDLLLVEMYKIVNYEIITGENGPEYVPTMTENPDTAPTRVVAVAHCAPLVDWAAVSAHEHITWNFMIETPLFPWDSKGASSNPNIALDTAKDYPYGIPGGVTPWKWDLKQLLQ